MTERAPTELGGRRFTPADQEAFARASGDHNPIHLDEVAARRSVAGSTVVHGVHLALWAIDRWATANPAAIVRLRASFLRPLLVGEDAVVRLVVDADGTEQLLVATGDEVKAVLLVDAGEPRPTPSLLTHPTEVPASAPRQLRFDEASGAAGTVPVGGPSLALTNELPNLASVLSDVAVAGMLAVSRVVGMECPGLHSLLAGFDLAVGEPGGDVLTWRVARATSPRSPIAIEVGGPVRGSVDAFFRPPPVEQPSWATVGEAVSAGEFAGQRALVIGGSRGLGEVTAKVLAAGGADVVVTYLRGQADADRVAAEIAAGGGRCEVRHVDVMAPPAFADLAVTHLYYFATPHIGTTRTFDPAAMATMLAVYVDGFWKTCLAAAGAEGGLWVLYPSSVFVADPPAGQAAYVVAKAAGEALASWMDRHVDGTRIVVERLPRLRTDQTASVLGAPPPDALPVLIAVLRAMHATARHR